MVFKIRAPSKTTSAFLLVSATVAGLIYRDKHLSKQVHERLAARVEHLAREPLGPYEMPRKVVVYLAEPPGDGIYKSRRWFREYIKPIFVAAALDYEIKEGSPTEITSMVQEEIRQRRKRALNALPTDASKDNGIESKLTRPEEVDGMIAVGRIAWCELLNGISAGCNMSLENPADISADSVSNEKTTIDSVEESIATEKELPEKPENISNSSTSPVAAMEESVLESLHKEPTDTSYFSLPPTSLISPVGFLPQENLLGFRNFPRRIFMAFNSYQYIERVGEEAVKICLGKTRELDTKIDLDLGRDEERVWRRKDLYKVEEIGEEEVEKKKVERKLYVTEVDLDERVTENLRVYC
ncbi:uncharacterized protein VTP21DRAFT_8411 [Calcarisporiella thermophila]|uniref:uncharacterized protein n=1 Tax=Calcarisporiella thermophila TaxID=911321 RepID=UPI00374259BD